MEENRIKEILDIADVNTEDSVFLIGADEPQVIDSCLKRMVRRILIVDDIVISLIDLCDLKKPILSVLSMS